MRASTALNNETLQSNSEDSCHNYSNLLSSYEFNCIHVNIILK